MNIIRRSNLVKEVYFNMSPLKTITLTLALLFFTTTNVLANSFTAILSCSMQGRHLNIYPCFKDTDLKISKNGQTKIYKMYELNNVGTVGNDGIHFSLPNKFSVTAQNSDKNLVLGIKILDKQNNVVYEDQAGKWGVIKVGH